MLKFVLNLNNSREQFKLINFIVKEIIFGVTKSFLHYILIFKINKVKTYNKNLFIEKLFIVQLL